jgi:hypothetical protein
MKTKYYQYTLQGEHSIEDMHRALGDAAVQGMIVRIDREGSQTRVYVATLTESVAEPQATEIKKAAATGDIKVKEVSESDVTKFA